MIIIIEGPDGSGKTTLANQLSKQTGYKIIHRVQPKTEEEKAIMMGEYLQTIRSGKNMIFDRCWYSEMVYGPVMRDASVIGYPQMYDLERQLSKAGAMIIYCTDSKAALWSRCQDRGEDYIVDRTTFDKICDGFDQLFAAPHYIPVVTYKCPDMHVL
jgi:thymidylate kinase